MRPEIFAFAHVDWFAQLEGQLDPIGDLPGVRPLETFLDENGVDETPNCGRKDDPGLHIA